MARKQIIAGLVLAAIAIFSVPLAANASTGEGDNGGCSVSPSTIKGGGSTVFSCTAGLFGDSESVHFTVSGDDGSNVSLASGQTVDSASTVGLTKLSNSNGSTSLNITVPKDASGAYAITATSATNGTGGAATITVVPASDPASTSGVSSTGSGSGLAHTGSNVSMSVVWAAGGIVFLGAIVLIASVLTRRRHANP